MFYPLLDYIVCTACKNPLILIHPKERNFSTTMRHTSASRVSQKGAVVGPLPADSPKTHLAELLTPLSTFPSVDGRERSVDIVEGILVCVYCEHWYPIRSSLPELLPDHLRQWDMDYEWLIEQQNDIFEAGLSEVWEYLLANTGPGGMNEVDEGAHYKRAEMSITQRDLPEGFFGPALYAPFNPSRPSFTLDLIARFVTTASRLDTGINGVIFDLGVGYGWTTEWLVRLGYQAIGVDITRDYILAGLPRMGNDIPHLIVADIENIPIRDECVDAALSFDAFHHLPDRKRTMRELNEAWT